MKKIPVHVAFIMDGNGRWTLNHGLKERTLGHEKGAANVHDIVIAADDLDIGFITFYTFSTENWTRPKSEVEFILQDLLVRYLRKELPFMMERNVRFNVIGDRDGIPENVNRTLDAVSEATKENTGLRLILAINYGGRREILDGMKRLARSAMENPDILEGLDEERFRDFLYDPGLPDPDLLIRTGGDMRLSNFFLWQLSYTEIYVTETLWPDFGTDEFKEALREYDRRQRRFGALPV